MGADAGTFLEGIDSKILEWYPCPACLYLVACILVVGSMMMDELSPRFWEIFFAVFDPLPRQGPGTRASAVKALACCRDLPECPVTLDLGCGNGGQTLYLAELVDGPILAIDSRATAIERLNAHIIVRELAPRVRAEVGDMACPGQPSGSFDLIWSEGALYSIGLQKALPICYELLRPGGYLVFTDAVWRKENPPPEVRASFDFDYPTMGWVDDDVRAIEAAGFNVEEHFTLPDADWWDDFYTPMEERIAVLRGSYFDDVEALRVLDQIAAEPEMHRCYAGYYAYEYFVARRALVVDK
jgi:SAM-dependent methyltransferase